MTIRTRLVVAAFLASAFVALAACTSTTFLYRASGHLQAIHTDVIPMVVGSGKVADGAGNLAQVMEDFVDAKSAGDDAAARAASDDINNHFDTVHASLDAFMRHLSALGTMDHDKYLADAERLRQASLSLDADWSRLRDITPGHREISRVTEFDDQAIRLVRSAIQIQADTVNLTSGRVDTANTYIVWVSHLSAVIAACTSVVTLVTGIAFASSLARRLIRVRNQAQIVGTGNLDTTLEVRGKDEIDEIALSFNDMVKALRGSREKLERDALYDGLTGLPNRVLFTQRLSHRVAEANRLNDHAYALFFLDIDRFKQVNDTLGHAAGDGVLRTVAARLTAAVNEFSSPTGRSAIVKTVARLAGDEFTILLEGGIGWEEARDLGERIRTALAVPMTVDGKPLVVTASIGIALGNADITDSKRILTRADTALYHTKRQGRNGWSLYASSMEEEDREHTNEQPFIPSALDFTPRARRSSTTTLAS